MFKAIALFELRTQIKRPLLWLVFGVFFIMAFGATVSDSVQIGGGIGNIHRNAPSVILQFHLILSIMSLLITTMFVAGAILRDFETGTYELFFSPGRSARPTTCWVASWRRSASRPWRSSASRWA
jgi:ABC-2 type transport system permease protein